MISSVKTTIALKKKEMSSTERKGLVVFIVYVSSCLHLFVQLCSALVIIYADLMYIVRLRHECLFCP